MSSVRDPKREINPWRLKDSTAAEKIPRTDAVDRKPSTIWFQSSESERFAKMMANIRLFLAFDMPRHDSAFFCRH